MAFPSSSSSSEPSKGQYDVFLSFRGFDTRNTFTSYLLNFLHRKGIDAFFDEKLRRGNDLSALFERIEQSKMSIVVFSVNYANSSWCLEELWKIMQCREKFGHGVLPIFYKVRKSDVENQTGSYQAPFQNPMESFKGDEHKVEAWKEALRSASNIAGFVLPEERPESEFVDKITKETFKMLNDLSPYEIHGFPGIESRAKELEELLMFDDETCIRTIGVLGMSGIGKTTVTDSVYKRSYRQFDGYCFLEDIGNESKRHGLHQLHKKLLCKLLDQENLDVRAHGPLKNFLRNKKLFIVLDNVTDSNQVELLIGEKELYRKGSRIVITTRDKKLLDNNVNGTYVVPRLNDTEAMELFCLNAFSDGSAEEFMDLADNFVYYAKGHPLALKLLGSGLCLKEKLYWTEKWDKLMVMPDKEIQKALKLSYEELDDEQKSIFLDIACFFRSEKKDFVLSILKSDRVNAKTVMKDLEDKCLVTTSYDRFEMHDLMYTMGKEIGYEASIKRAGRRSRLWNHKDIRQVLEQRTGTECIRGIFLNMSSVKTIKLSPDTFMKMSNLKFLKFHNSHCSQWCDSDDKFQFSKVIDHFPDELVYLHWQGYPYEYLPLEFNPEELVYLNLRYSNIKHLWLEEKDTKNLRWVDLSWSKDLLNLSGLSKAKNLERLDLEGCTSLSILGSSISQMNQLVYLNLKDCTSLNSLPKGINLKALKTLILTGCSKLQDFEIISENIESLYLEGTAIEQVAEHIETLHNLIVLNLKNCHKLKYLPNDLYKVKSLQELILSGCSALENLPAIKEEMLCLEILLMDGTSIKHTPEMICLSNLRMFSFNGSSIQDAEFVLLPFAGCSLLSDLYLTNCSISKLPDNFSFLDSLRSLCLSRNNIETLPESIEKLHCLVLLDLKYCRRLSSLPVLPRNLQYLDAHGCISLEKVANPVTVPLVTARMYTSTFIFTDCWKLKREEQEAIVTHSQLKSQLMARTSLQHHHKGLVLEPLVAVCFPGSEIPSWFLHQRMGSSLETNLHPHWCNTKFIGASLCVIVSFKNHHFINRLTIKCICKFKNQKFQSETSFSFNLGGWNQSCGSSSCHESRTLGSDHVFISYNNCNVPLVQWNQESNNGDRCDLTSASFEFYISDDTESKVEFCKVTRCGMSLLYAADENERRVQGTRVRDMVECNASKVLVPMRDRVRVQCEEKVNGRIRDTILN